MVRVCPNCKKEYQTVLERHTDQNIQVEYPNAPSWQREQLITGICSDVCWDSFLGITQE